MLHLSGDSADMKDEMIQRGISALKDYLGADNASALLRPAELRVGEAVAFYFPLPVDYTGLERRLRIGFPNDFPSESPSLQVEPSLNRPGNPGD